MFNKMKAGGSYIIGGSEKGLTIHDIINYNLPGADYAEAQPVSVEAAYAQEGWFKRCADVFGWSLSGLPWSVSKPGAEEPLWTYDTSAPEDLEWLHIEDFLFRCGVSLKLTGAAYALKPQTMGQSDPLQWFSPSTVTPIQTAEGISAFKRLANGKEFTIPAEHMVYIYKPGVFAEQGPGSSEGVAAKVYAQVLLDQATYTSDQLRSGLIKKTIFTADKDARPPDELQKKSIKEFLRRFILGAKGTPPEVLTGGINAQMIGSDLSDLASEELSNLAREAIATSLGVPHSIVMSNSANFATAEQDNLNFLTTSVLPVSNVVSRSLNAQLFKGLGLEFKFEPAKLEAFQNIEDQKAEKIFTLTGIPPLTINEGRERMGLNPFTPPELQAHIDLHKAPTLAFDSSTSTGNEEAGGKALDIKRWRKKASRNRKASFNPDALTRHEELTIKQRLAEGQALDEVFSPPYEDF